MKTHRFWILLSAVSILLTAAILILFEIDDGGKGLPPPSPILDGGPEGALHPRVESKPGGTPSGSTGNSADRASGKKAIPVRGLRIAGIVVAMPEGAPVQGARVSFLHLAGIRGHAPHAPSPIPVRTDEKGKFVLPVPSPGLYGVQARAPGCAPAASGQIEVLPGGKVDDLLLVLEPGLQVSGRVVEGATGYPVSNVLVTTTLQSRILWRLDRREETFCSCVRTDGQGRFTLHGIDPRDTEVRLAALHPDFAEGLLTTRPCDRDVRIRLERGHRIHGRVLDDEGAPAEGVEIRVDRAGPFVQRRAFTGADGRYATPPLAPGKIRISAAPADPLPGRPRTAVAFTPESRTVEMKDSGLEVNFGPLPDRVTWRGRLLDARDRPVPKAEIALFLDPGQGGNVSFRRNLWCDEKGCFEAAKLLPGRYTVRVCVPEAGFATDLPPVTLERAGVQDQDLHLPGGSIQGVVVCDPTGEAVPFGEVRAQWSSRDGLRSGKGFSAVRAPVDDQGRFFFQGLRPGRWELVLLRFPYDRFIPGYRDPWILDGPGVGKDGKVALGPEEHVEGIRITTRAAGRVSIRGTGFTRAEADRFQARFIQEHCTASAHARTFHSDGSFEAESWLKPGQWEVRLFLGTDRPSVVRWITVEPKGLVELPVRRDAFPAATQAAVVSGSVRFADGRPAPGARVLLTGRAPTDSGLYLRREATCDSAGRFTLPMVSPGTWAVSLTGLFRSGPYGQGPEYHVKDLVVPGNPCGEIPLHVTVPPGSLTGTLCDASTGARLPEACGVTLRLMDAAAERTLLEAEGLRGARFELPGVPSSTFRLEIEAEGFLGKTTDPFTFQGPQTLELPPILLEPAAFLVVEARDAAGAFLNVPVQVRFSEPAGPKEALYLGPGRLRFRLPPGAVSGRVEAEGFRPQGFTAIVEAGGNSCVKVALDPLPR